MPAERGPGTQRGGASNSRLPYLERQKQFCSSGGMKLEAMSRTRKLIESGDFGVRSRRAGIGQWRSHLEDGCDATTRGMVPLL